MRKLLVIMTYLGMTMSFVILGVIGFWLLYPYKILEITEAPVVLNSPVVAGEDIVYSLKFCKYSDIHGTLRRQLVDTVVTAYPLGAGTLEKGCRELTAVLQTPTSLPDGNYKVNFSMTYKVNPIRDVMYNYESNTFQIVNKKL